MIRWEDRAKFALDGPEGSWVVELANGIEAIGAPVIEADSQPTCIHEAEGGRYWFKHNKVWEYPMTNWWLSEFSDSIGKESLKLMDFGCWICPFPEYLANKGHEVWGVDDDSWGHMKKCDLAKHYPNVTYFMDDVMNLDEGGFDAIFSCSVFEHIMPDELRVQLMQKLRSMLAPNGKMLHIVDFYFPGKPGRDGQRMDFYKVANAMDWTMGNPNVVPGSPTFDFSEVQEMMRARWIREQCQEARIAIGDHIWN